MITPPEVDAAPISTTETFIIAAVSGALGASVGWPWAALLVGGMFLAAAVCAITDRRRCRDD